LVSITAEAVQTQNAQLNDEPSVACGVVDFGSTLGQGRGRGPLAIRLAGTLKTPEQLTLAFVFSPSALFASLLRLASECRGVLMKRR
jgi:hypothetical protein